MNNVTAEYILRDDGMIDVINSGWKEDKYKVADGKARQPEVSLDTLPYTGCGDGSTGCRPSGSIRKRL